MPCAVKTVVLYCNICFLISKLFIPIFPIQSAVLDGLRNMRAAYFFLTVKIRDGTRYFENPVVGPGGKPQFFKCVFQQFTCRFRHVTYAMQDGGSDSSVAGNPCSLIPLSLKASGGIHAGFDLAGGLPLFLGIQMVKADRGYFHMEVHPV